MAKTNVLPLAAFAPPIAKIDSATVRHKGRFDLLTQIDCPEVAKLRALCSEPTYQSAAPAVHGPFPGFVEPNTGLVFTSDGRVVQESLAIASLWLPRMGLEQFMAILLDEVQAQHYLREERGALHCIHRGTDAFGHFVLDVLPSILLALDKLRSNDMRLLFPAFTKTWIEQRLHDVGMVSPPVKLAHLTFCQNLYVSNLLTTRNTYFTHPRSLGALRDAALSTARGTGRKIYLARGADQGRNGRIIVNESDLCSALAKEGFAIVQPAELDFRKQIRLFAEASVIVGAHGSSFGNLAFSHPGTQVVDLMPQGWVGYFTAGETERWLYKLTAAFDLDYTLVLCKSITEGPPTHTRGQRSLIKSTVAIDALMDRLRTLS